LVTFRCPAWAAERIADALLIDAATVREHWRLHATAGLGAIACLAYAGGAADLCKEQRAAVEPELAGKIHMAAKEVHAFAHERFGIKYTANAMSKPPGRPGFVCKKPGCVPARADVAVQRRVAEPTPVPLMAAANAGKPLYFAAASHPATTAHPASGWIKQGETRELKSNHCRVNVGTNGAPSWPDRTVVRREAGKITSAVMIELFDDLAARHPTASAITVVLNNASYNHSAGIGGYLAQDGRRMRLVYLPPYAPNLNLIERLWLLMKKKALWNKHYPTLAEFKAAIGGFSTTSASIARNWPR